MIRKKFEVFILIGLMCIVSAISSLAKEINIISTGLDGSILIEKDRQSTGYTQDLRGSVISTGTLKISNAGDGEIGVYMQNLAHKDVDETKFFVYLDKWIESDEEWVNITKYEFSFSKKDNPEENLAAKSISFNIIDQPANFYYRLRGVHIVVADGIRETLSSRTDGILITK